ncbi:hypothetical protein BJX99DRAFT_236599 [Aspergillus californicus]
MPPRTRDVTQQGDSTTKEKRKPVRRDPEKRRQQNIQAQRKYREKLRERLDRLEAFAASAVQDRDRTTDKSPSVEKASKVPLDIPSHSNPPRTNPSPSNSPATPAYNVFDASAAFPPATLADCQPIFPQIDVASSMSIWNPATDCLSSLSMNPATDCLSSLSMWDPMTLLSQPDDMTASLSMWYPQPHIPLSDTTPALSISASSPFGRQSDSSPEESIWDPSIHGLSDCTPTATTVSETSPRDPSVMTRHEGTAGFRPYWTTTVNCGCSSPHFQIQSQGSKPFSFGDIKIMSLQPSAPDADLYANHLRIDSICTITALYGLSMHVGITEDLICGEETPSMFFQSGAQTADASVKANTVRNVRAAFKSLKPDMRPSAEQIFVPHHPYIDIIPFPSLRKYLIAHQDEIDEDCLFHDLLTGLVCWGGGGLSKSDRNLSTGYASTGTPWDVRSWEARTWFLKKYWVWLGGEEGELVRQSEWWRNIRGDDEYVDGGVEEL